MFIYVCSPILPGCRCVFQAPFLPLRPPCQRPLLTCCTHLSPCGHVQAGGAGDRRCVCQFVNIDFLSHPAAFVFFQTYVDVLFFLFFHPVQQIWTWRKTCSPLRARAICESAPSSITLPARVRPHIPSRLAAGCGEIFIFCAVAACSLAAIVEF